MVDLIPGQNVSKQPPNSLKEWRFSVLRGYAILRLFLFVTRHLQAAKIGKPACPIGYKGIAHESATTQFAFTA